MKTFFPLPPFLVIASGLPVLLAGLIGASPVSAQTISSYSVEKRIDYNQTSSSTPVPGTEPDDPAGSFVFDAGINGTNLSSLATPSLIPPGGGSDNLNFDSGAGSWNIYGGATTFNFATQTALDSAFPNGLYTMTMNSSPVTLTLSGPAGASVYPASIPTVTNGTWAGGALVVNAATGSPLLSITSPPTATVAGLVSASTRRMARATRPPSW